MQSFLDLQTKMEGISVLAQIHGKQMVVYFFLFLFFKYKLHPLGSTNVLVKSKSSGMKTLTKYYKKYCQLFSQT